MKKWYSVTSSFALFSLAVSLFYTAFTPVIQNVSAVSATDIQTCNIPLTFYTKFGDDIRADKNANFDPDTYNMVGFCSSEDGYPNAVYIGASPTEGLTNWEWTYNTTYNFIGLKTQAPATMWARVYTDINNPSAFAYWSNGSSSWSSGLYFGVTGTSTTNKYFDWTNATLKDSAYDANVGALPPDKYAFPDITDQMSFSYKVENNRVSVWNTTPNPPVDPATLWCSWNITNNYTAPEDLITYYSTAGYRESVGSSWGTTSCQDVIEFEVEIPSVVHVTLEVHDDDTNSYGEISQNINVDGTSFTGTAGASFNTVDTDYDDCNAYGWDVAQRLTCEIKNAGLRMRDFAIFMFTPSRTRINSMLNGGSVETHGLLGVIVAPLGLVDAVANSYGNCQPLALPLPFVNTDLTLPCMTDIYEQHFGALFTMYQLIITAVLGYWVSVRVLADVKAFKDPHKDQIEVLDL